MAGPQPRKGASTNKRGGSGDAVAAALARYTRDLERAPLAARTRDAYAQHVAAYAAWLSERAGAEAALEDPRARDYAARDFKRWLKGERRWKPASVNLALRRSITSTGFSGSGRRA